MPIEVTVKFKGIKGTKVELSKKQKKELTGMLRETYDKYGDFSPQSIKKFIAYSSFTERNTTKPKTPEGDTVLYWLQMLGGSGKLKVESLKIK